MACKLFDLTMDEVKKMTRTGKIALVEEILIHGDYKEKKLLFTSFATSNNVDLSRVAKECLEELETEKAA